MMILIVDDDQINRRLFEAQVKRLGFDAHVVTNGEEAVAAISSDPNAYDLVLMDIWMPGMDGYETTRRIREATHARTKPLPIIALTAQTLALNEEHMRQAGLDDRLSKPVSQEHLRATLSRWLPQDA